MNTITERPTPHVDVDLVRLAERIDVLERENRRLKRMGATALVLISVLVAAGAQPSEGPARNGTVEAEQFIVRDRTGKERARLALGDDGSPRLFFRDGEGRVRLQMSVGPNGTPGLR